MASLLKRVGLSRSTNYYQVKAMAVGDRLAPLKASIQSIQDTNKGRYGYRRMTAAVRNSGYLANSKTVRRLMSELNLVCKVRPKKYRSYRGLMGEASPNILSRQFEAEQPNQKWVTDVTEFKVAGEKLYLSPILDLYNGEIVTYQTAARPRYALVGDMLEQALEQLPQDAKPMLHSDQGWHYRYPSYRKRLEKAGLEQSMSRKGNCLDNATMESFFGTLKSEYYYRERFDSVVQLQAGLDEYIRYYNHERIKMKLGGMSPVREDADPEQILQRASATLETFSTREGMAQLRSQLSGGKILPRKPGKPTNGVNLASVLKLRARGLNQAEISRELGLSRSTVNCYWKLSVNQPQ